MFNGQERMILGIIVVIYFAFLFGISLYINRRIKTYDDYNVAGRSVSIFPLILTFVGTAIGGSTLLGFMENGYNFGMGQQWLKFGSIFTSILILFFLVKRIRRLGEKYNMVTIGDYTALRYGEGARLPTVISILVAYCAITGMQFVAIATLLNLTIGLSITSGIIISWALLTLKTYFGGLKAVIWQDAFHGTIQTVGIFILFAVVLIAAGGWENISQNAHSLNEGNMLSIFNISPTELFVYVLTIGGYQFVRQDVWQRFWAAKDFKTTMNGFWISIIVSFLTGVFVVTLGVMGRYGLNLGNIDPTLIYYEIIGNVLPFPVVVIMIVALMATVISCADSFFMAGASSIVNDIVKPRVKNVGDSKMLLYSRMSVVIVSIVALMLSLYIPQLVNLWVTGTAMLVSGLLAPVLFGLFWRRATGKAGVTSMWLGLIVAVIWQVSGHPFGIHPVFIGLPLSILTLIIVSFLTKQNDNQSLLLEAK
ncbi:sodium:solute symporter family protein [Halobacillus shinanisalinarum]|uniref:Sodium:solute symporter family protein n=1 Tax=Halobacillus shinanisalinarum TaxID=2932258 RepID=A0ABY4GVW8_9BACI|nr:sodium:solute symporter family protein [Halobacillus shinanisalinarum]UOQ92305.1 sodium:solute symporter family protein [Halobacillus shinanisalinarum]